MSTEFMALLCTIVVMDHKLWYSQCSHLWCFVVRVCCMPLMFTPVNSRLLLFSLLSHAKWIMDHKFWCLYSNWAILLIPALVVVAVVVVVVLLVVAFRWTCQ